MKLGHNGMLHVAYGYMPYSLIWVVARVLTLKLSWENKVSAELIAQILTCCCQVVFQ